MTYESIWWALPEALERVMATTGGTEPEVKADICRAIVDGAIGHRGKLKEDRTKLRTSDAVVEGKELRPWHGLKPEDLDWENSRPLKLWEVAAERLRVSKLWYLDRIELSVADVTQHLGRPERQDDAAQDTLSDPGAAIRSQSAPESSDSYIYADFASLEPAASGSARRRGPKPKKLKQTIDAMRNDIREGRRTAAQLEAMPEKTLSADYGGVSRDTARKARNAVLSEFGENNLQQTPTNDN
jgi:hypothetical protein